MDLHEPMIFISAAQGECRRNADVRKRIPTLNGATLPCWVPAHEIGTALGFDSAGVERAMASLAGKPYLWATEFENVHSLWEYCEPKVEVDGESYDSSEAYYHSQKPYPFSDAVWNPVKESVMERGVRAKLKADPTLEALLLATHPHPLLALKPDRIWGFHPVHGGENLLARTWMRIRDELVASIPDP